MIAVVTGALPVKEDEGMLVEEAEAEEAAEVGEIVVILAVTAVAGTMA